MFFKNQKRKHRDYITKQSEFKKSSGIFVAAKQGREIVILPQERNDALPQNLLF